MTMFKVTCFFLKYDNVPMSDTVMVNDQCGLPHGSKICKHIQGLYSCGKEDLHKKLAIAAEGVYHCIVNLKLDEPDIEHNPFWFFNNNKANAKLLDTLVHVDVFSENDEHIYSPTSQLLPLVLQENKSDYILTYSYLLGDPMFKEDYFIVKMKRDVPERLDKTEATHILIADMLDLYNIDKYSRNLTSIHSNQQLMATHGYRIIKHH